MSDKYLVTGAAGFIGSNLIEQLIKNGEDVVALDNFSTGKKENIDLFRDKIKFVEGDIRDLDLCKELCQGCDYVLHQAAMGSVPRSVEDPLGSNDNNVTGSLNMLVAARDAKVKKFVYAASSSAYGDTRTLPKIETMQPAPLSPYAVTKYVNELYAKVFNDTYGLATVGLRYFNVFGKRQDPDGAYAAVIPKFVKSILNNEPPHILGDGGQTRDFTFIDNVVQANLLACKASAGANGEVMNIGAGGRISLNDLTMKMLTLLNSDLSPTYGAIRAGDVRDSQADISKAQKLIGYDPEVDALTGLELALDWYRDNL
ncbi:MAG: SDR family oxidoreductase [Deltaproteobacteria bacterium]|nr:SDR family oxidoreductase [Deltaproteobacteria bacterium]